MTMVRSLEVEMAVRRTISRHEELRRQLGLSVTDLAARLGYSHAWVSMVEGGQVTPSAKYRRRVAKFFRVPEEIVFPEEAA